MNHEIDPFAMVSSLPNASYNEFTHWSTRESRDMTLLICLLVDKLAARPLLGLYIKKVSKGMTIWENTPLSPLVKPIAARKADAEQRQKVTGCRMIG